MLFLPIIMAKDKQITTLTKTVLVFQRPRESGLGGSRMLLENIGKSLLSFGPKIVDANVFSTLQEMHMEVC